MTLVAWLVVGVVAGFLASVLTGAHEGLITMIVLGNRWRRGRWMGRERRTPYRRRYGRQQHEHRRGNDRRRNRDLCRRQLQSSRPVRLALTFHGRPSRAAMGPEQMGRAIVMNGLTLDGVMQSPARPDEDTKEGFRHGAWAIPYADAGLVAQEVREIRVRRCQQTLGPCRRRSPAAIVLLWPIRKERCAPVPVRDTLQVGTEPTQRTSDEAPVTGRLDWKQATGVPPPLGRLFR